MARAARAVSVREASARICSCVAADNAPADTERPQPKPKPKPKVATAPPPNPSKDPEAKRLPIDASGTAAFPYGNPKAVGQGAREAIARNTSKPKKAGAAGAVAEPEADDEESESDE